VIVTADNEHDFGRPGIQYVHYPRCLFPRPAVDLRWYHYPKALLNAYYAVCNRFSSLSLDGLERNLTLVNSDYIGGLVRQRYQITPRTIYPPVTATFPDVPWESREDAFVCIGRIAPEKELERVIDILTRVRLRFPAVQLHIVGTPGLRSYYRRIRSIAERTPWISLHENLSREELVAFVPRHRYGIHGMLEEHFGMAPAEMVRAGCIVFVPRGGGQVEIVGRDERLCYRTVEEAAQSICETLANPERQAELRHALAARQPLFSTDRFVSAIRTLISEFPSSPLPPA
jgi:glycosyltransferase involved in cell wall biosynthesis